MFVSACPCRRCHCKCVFNNWTVLLFVFVHLEHVHRLQVNAWESSSEPQGSRPAPSTQTRRHTCTVIGTMTWPHSPFSLCPYSPALILLLLFNFFPLTNWNCGTIFHFHFRYLIPNSYKYMVKIKTTLSLFLSLSSVLPPPRRPPPLFSVTDSCFITKSWLNQTCIFPQSSSVSLDLVYWLVYA